MSGTQVQIDNIGVMPKGAALTLAHDFTNMVTDKGTTLSTATVTTDDSAVTIGTPQIASNVVTVTLTAAQTGCAMIKILGTLADTDIWPVYWKIEVQDPRCDVQGSTDYGQ